MKILKNEKMNSYELESKRASYRTIVNMYISDLVLCNKVSEDQSIWDNLLINTDDEYYPEIYQFYLCNLSDYEKEKLQEAGLIVSYSDELELDVLMVDHYGTSWDYVLTDVKIVDSYEELEGE